MARKFHVEKDRTLLYWAVGLLLLGLWHLRDGWFTPASVLEKHPPGDPAHAYYYIYNKAVAVLSTLASVVCAVYYAFRK
jgi:hypothetical protein